MKLDSFTNVKIDKSMETIKQSQIWKFQPNQVLYRILVH